jgi:hypothetical protein
MINTYFVGTAIELSGLFRDKTGLPVDPSVVRCRVKSPSDIETTYTYGDEDSVVVKNSDGSYSVEIIADEAGTWHYRFDSENKHVAFENTFVVKPSHFSLLEEEQGEE